MFPLIHGLLSRLGVVLFAPPAPTGLSGTVLSATEIRLQWFDNSSGASQEDGFEIQYDTSDTFGSPTSDWAGQNSTSRVVTGLTASTTYWFRVRAYNSKGNSDWSNVISKSTPSATEPAWVLHIDANVDTYETNGGSASINDGDVGYWVDQSGSGNHVQQTTASRKPHLFTEVLNGLSVVRGDGTQQAMSSINTIALQSLTAIGVFVVRTIANGRILYHFTSPDGWLLANTSQFGFFTINGSVATNVDLPTGVPMVLTVQRNNSTGLMTVRQNGIVVGERSATINSATANLWLWAAFNLTAFAHADIGELYVANSALSESQIEVIEERLATKWGITTNNQTNYRYHLWVDANEGTYVSDGGAASGNNGEVGYWEDKSGWVSHNQQATAANRPLLKTNAWNGLSLVSGDGVDDRIGTIRNVSIQHFTVFWVGVKRKAANLQRLIYQYDGTNGFMFDGEGAYNFAGTAPADPSQLWNMATDNLMIITATYAAGLVTVRRNGEQIGTFAIQNPRVFSWSNVWLLASSVPNRWAKADVGEVRIAPSVLTGDQIAYIENQLAEKWGVPLNGDKYFPPVPLVTPTYVAGDQAVHPAVVDAGNGNLWPASGDARHRYWMAMTPYPDSNAAVEDPSILVSDDLITWAVPTGLTNPIAPSPAGSAHNADTELILHTDDKLYCFWIDTAVTGYNMQVKSSADGVTWSSMTTLFSGSYAVCPTVFWDGTQYVMIYVDGETTAYVLRYRTCATPDGTWSSESNITLNDVPSGAHPWNISARRIGANQYLAIVHFPPTSAPQVGGGAWWATSTNGTVWDVVRQEVATGDYDTIQFTIYQSCFIPVTDSPGSYWLYFSGRTGTSSPNRVWRTNLKYVASI